MTVSLLAGCGSGYRSSPSSPTNAGPTTPLMTATVTNLTPSSEQVSIGQSVMVQATVSPSTAVGGITVLDGSQKLGTAMLTGGNISFSLSNLAVGPHIISAVYAGSGNFSGSTSPSKTIDVESSTLASTSTTLSASSVLTNYGDTLTLTALVAPSDANGAVTFYDAAAIIGVQQLSSGSASLSVASLAKGTHMLSAVYGGSALYKKSTASVR